MLLLCILHSSITTANFENVRNFTGHEEVYPLNGVVTVQFAEHGDTVDFFHKTVSAAFHKTVAATLSGTRKTYCLVEEFFFYFLIYCL